MKSVRLLTHLLLVGWLIPPLVAQQRAALRISEVLPIPEQHALAIQEPVKCGPDGRVYVRFVIGQAEPRITIISEDGKKVSRVGLEAVPDLQSALVVDFSPGPDGESYLLAAKEEDRGAVQHYVVKFRQDGTPNSVAKLDVAFRPNFLAKQLAAFNSGQLLIAGYQRGTSEPVTAIFGEDGRFLKEMVLPGDLEKKEDASQETGKGGSTKYSAEDRLGFALDSSWLQLADDGSVYLMRDSPEGPLYVISPGGVVRRLLLKPPKQGQFVSVKVARGMIAAEYTLPRSSPRDKRTSIFVLTDTGSGETAREYESQDARLGVGMVCYDRTSFTFLAGEDLGLLLLRAVPQ